jgi:hypothetical protein
MLFSNVSTTHPIQGVTCGRFSDAQDAVHDYRIFGSTRRSLQDMASFIRTPPDVVLGISPAAGSDAIRGTASRVSEAAGAPRVRARFSPMDGE